LLFPGSRPAIRNLSLKWFVKVTRHVNTLIPGVRFTTLFSPFVPENEMPVWKDAGLNPVKSDTATPIGIATMAGSAMRTADYALTQPGTNTLEMMHCGLPALVAVPFDFLDAAPVSGLGRLVSRVPLLGKTIKEWKVRQSLRRFGGFLSWPNRIAGRAILDEAIGNLTPYDLAERVAASLEDKKKLACVRGELLKLSGEGGAASRLCDAAENAVY